MESGGQTFDTVINQNAPGAGSVTLKNTSVGANKNVLINGAANVEGTLNIPSTGSLTANELNFAADSALNVQGDANNLVFQDIGFRSGAQITIGTTTYTLTKNVWVHTSSTSNCLKFTNTDSGTEFQTEAGKVGLDDAMAKLVAQGYATQN